MDASDKELFMEVASLVIDPTTHAPIVVLKEVGGDIYLPLWIGIAEANSIAIALRGLRNHRPLSHDLIYSIICELGGTVSRVVIHRLVENVYFANVEIPFSDSIKLLDARPSDAIAVAIRFGVPIIVTRNVVEAVYSKIKIGYDYTAGILGIAVTAPDSDFVGNNISSGEFSRLKEPDSEAGIAVNRHDWSQILSRMVPGDFKYKM